MDFLFSGGGGQTSQLSLATAPSAGPSLQQHQYYHDLELISAAATGASGGGGGGSTSSSTSAIHFNGHDNGPILYDNLNRTSAIDDIRSVVIYIFILTIFLSFFLILPGIRNEKFPTFLCITTSLLVSSIIIISLNGTTWHVGEAPISAPYKAFSRDRIQGDLSVRIGLQSVNISLRAHKYYILHATDGPMIMENVQQTFSLIQQPLKMMMMMAQPGPGSSPTNRSLEPAEGGSGREATSDQEIPASAAASSFIHRDQPPGPQPGRPAGSLTDELLTGRGSDGGLAIDTELEVDEPFSSAGGQLQGPSDLGDQPPVVGSRRVVRSSAGKNETRPVASDGRVSARATRAARYTVKRLHVDINYNERFYWIGPMQMRQEYQHALERGLPYPILTCVEYLSQDEAGFSWARRYRAAGYYTSMLLWASASLCALMFCLHCAAPKYGIYAMQALGLLLLCASLTYATLVPRGDQKLVIPFEGQSVTFRLGWNFWLVLVGGCLALLVGTTIVILDKLFPNFIFTTVLDVNFDSPASQAHFQRKHKILRRANSLDEGNASETNESERTSAPTPRRRPKVPPFMRNPRVQKLGVVGADGTTKKSKPIASKTVTQATGHAQKQVNPIDAKLAPSSGAGHRFSAREAHWIGQSGGPNLGGDREDSRENLGSTQEIDIRL